MNRIGFILKVKEDLIDEYKRRHEDVWPEMLEALHRTGWHNYTLFMRDDGMLFGYRLLFPRGRDRVRANAPPKSSHGSSNNREPIWESQAMFQLLARASRIGVEHRLAAIRVEDGIPGRANQDLVASPGLGVGPDVDLACFGPGGDHRERPDVAH
jgi:hypothetical protein